MKHLRKHVFYPPLVLIFSTIVFSQIDNDAFSAHISGVNQWVLQNFGFLFSTSSFAFVLILLITYLSPLAKNRIGGRDATPILSKSRWFAISICTTIATGILFWVARSLCITTLIHLFRSSSKIRCCCRLRHVHYVHALVLYTLCHLLCGGLVFAFSYYNLKQQFSVSSMVIIKEHTVRQIVGPAIDVLCLFSLVLGMSASLGAGIYSIIGGLENILGVQKSDLLIGIVGGLIILSFIISAISGLQKGIKWLSSVNIVGFILIALFVALFSYPVELINLLLSGLIEYGSTFIQRNINWNSDIDQAGENDWDCILSR